MIVNNGYMMLMAMPKKKNQLNFDVLVEIEQFKIRVSKIILNGFALLWLVAS